MQKFDKSKNHHNQDGHFAVCHLARSSSIVYRLSLLGIIVMYCLACS